MHCIAQMREEGGGGGGGPACPNCLAHFKEVHFWSIKGVYFFQNANDLNIQVRGWG